MAPFALEHGDGFAGASASGQSKQSDDQLNEEHARNSHSDLTEMLQKKNSLLLHTSSRHSPLKCVRGEFETGVGVGVGGSGRRLNAVVGADEQGTGKNAW